MSSGSGLGWCTRSALATSAGAAIALGGHLLGGGRAPSAAGAIVALLAPALLSTVVAMAGWTGPRLVATLAGAQALAHLTLSLVAPAGPMDDPLRMLAWHAVGTAGSAYALLRVERLHAAVCALLLAMLLAVARPSAPEQPTAVSSGRVPPADALPRPRSLLQMVASPRRGPPARAA